MEYEIIFCIIKVLSKKKSLRCFFVGNIFAHFIDASRCAVNYVGIVYISTRTCFYKLFFYGRSIILRATGTSDRRGEKVFYHFFFFFFFLIFSFTWKSTSLLKMLSFIWRSTTFWKFFSVIWRFTGFSFEFQF